MKTFIWSREYEVLAANADTLEEAIELLKPKLDALLDPKLTDVIKDRVHYEENFTIENTPLGYYRDSAWWDRDIKFVEESITTDKAILNNPPNFIIEENQAMIFYHANE